MKNGLGLSRLHSVQCCVTLAVPWAFVAMACGDVNRSPRELMQAGLSKALPDEKLGPAAVLRMDETAVDPLFRDIVAAASELNPLSVSSVTTWKVLSGATPVFELQEIAKVTTGEDLDYSGEVTRKLDRPAYPTETVRKLALFVRGRFFTSDTAESWFEHQSLRPDALKWRYEALKPLPELLELLDPWVARTAVGPTTWHARPAHKLRLTMVSGGASGGGALPSVGSTTRNQLHEWPRWWRANHIPVELFGELVVEDRCKCVVSAELNAKFEILKQNEPPRLLQIRHKTTAEKLKNSPDFSLPSDVELPARERVMPMIEEVLGDYIESP